MPDFKPQTWHVELSIPDEAAEVVDKVIAAFATRLVAQEVCDEWNAENHVIGQPAAAYICLCDCPNRDCRYV